MNSRLKTFILDPLNKRSADQIKLGESCLSSGQPDNNNNGHSNNNKLPLLNCI